MLKIGKRHILYTLLLASITLLVFMTSVAQSWQPINAYGTYFGVNAPNAISPSRVDLAGCSATSSWIWFYNVPQSKIGNLYIEAYDFWNQVHIANQTQIGPSGGLNGNYQCI